MKWIGQENLGEVKIGRLKQEINDKKEKDKNTQIKERER